MGIEVFLLSLLCGCGTSYWKSCEHKRHFLSYWTFQKGLCTNNWL